MSFYRHKKDKDGSCAKMGGKAETNFRLTMVNRGHLIEPVDKNLQLKHVDFVLDKNIKIEVKSSKRLSRQDISANHKYIWLEVSSVYYKEGKNGWLYGESDLVAFENEGKFIIVKRLDLVSLAEEMCDYRTFVKRPQDALYKSYRRWDRPTEHIVLIKVEDLFKIEHKIVPMMLSPEGSYYLVARETVGSDFFEVKGWTFDFDRIQKDRDKLLQTHKEVLIKKREKS